MIAICVICRHGLDSPPEAPRDRRICTTECGHIFHVFCINAWWRAMMMQTEIGQPHQYKCPLCRRISPVPHVFQLYPSSQERTEAELDARIAELQEDNQELRAALEATNRELENAKKSLLEMKATRAHHSDANNNRRDSSA